MATLHTYLPQDRLRALARGETLPDRTAGAALFADISGFTPLTEALTLELGAQRGAEELSRQINAVYEKLIAEVENFGGSVLSFAGDSITCWFDGDTGLDAVASALAMQSAMKAFSTLWLKVAVTTGPARRFVVGDPAIRYFDALAGATITRLARAEHLAGRGEVMLDVETADVHVGHLDLGEWRTAENGERFVVVQALMKEQAPRASDGSFSVEAETLRPWSAD
jgi:class 3 adenylate cyclase